MTKQYSLGDFKRILKDTKPSVKVEVVDGNYVAYGELSTLFLYEDSFCK